MRLAIAMGFAVLVWAGATVAAGPAFPILDEAGIPHATAKTRAGYAEFLVSGLPRAFAVGSDGSFGGSWGQGSLEVARAKALENCSKAGGIGCAIYAENLDVVWLGERPAQAPAVPDALISGTGYAFVPDPRFLWHGPQAARGIVVWSHGKGKTDERGEQPPSYTRWFNNAGFDVVRFDRAMEWDDKERAAQWLRDGLAALRARGWRMVVAAGQSRGAWNSLQMLDTPGLADVVIAVSPAAQGTDAGNIALRQGPELYTIAQRAHAPQTRVAFVQFAHDPYSDNQDERVDRFRNILFHGVAAGLIIDRPDGFSGHGAGFSSEFGLKYGSCLLHFALDATPPKAC
jgi:hypothetical protein